MAKITAVSTALIPNKGKLELFPYTMDSFRMLAGDTYAGSLTGRLGEIITDKISIYDTQLGYPSNLTAETVIKILSASATVYHILRDYLKRNNVKQFNDSHKVEVGLALSRKYIHDVAITNINLKPDLDIVYEEVASVSNAVWQRLIGKAEGLVSLPEAWSKVISYYVDSFFSLHSRNDDGCTQLINFQLPTYAAFDEIGEYANQEAILQAGLTLLSDTYLANPSLRAFLYNHMGFISAIATSDFTRDITQRTISILEDNELLNALETTPNVHLYGIDPDAILDSREFMYTPGDIYFFPQNFEDFIEIDTDTMIEKLFTMSVLDDGENVSIINMPIRSTFLKINCYRGTVFYSIPHGNVYLPKLTSLASSVLKSVEDSVMRITSAFQSFPLDLPFTPDYFLQVEDSELICITIDDSNILTKFGVRPGYNLFSIDEDVLQTIRVNNFLSLIFGGIPFKFSHPVPLVFDESSKLENSKNEENKSKGKGDGYKTNRYKGKQNRNLKDKRNGYKNKGKDRDPKIKNKDSEQ